jgi:peptidoglycan/LPS O-acetylase OafA/YrhL
LAIGVAVEHRVPVNRVTEFWEPRYFMVDAWRGLASLGVVFAHLGIRVGFSLGEACVMVFFVISGYCIAAATVSCQRNKLSPLDYMRRRIRRIYPPYFFALCLYTAASFVKLRIGMGDDLSRSVVAWIQNLTLTQWLSMLVHPIPLPSNNPVLFVSVCWSLNYEEQFYIVMGLLMFAAVFRKDGILSEILLLMIPAFLWNLYHPIRFNGFFLDYWVSFALGAVVFYRLCKTTRARERIALDLGLLALLVFSLYRNATMRLGDGSVYWAWIVTSSFALLLVHLRTLDGRFKASTAGKILGKFGLISYSLYLTHQLTIRVCDQAAEHIHSNFPGALGFLVRAVTACSAAAIFWYFCERPFLNKPLPNKVAIANAS